MSFEPGRTITDMEYIKKHNIKLEEISTILSEVFNRQIFELGFVHADPHPGNLFIRKEQGMTKLVLLDHGLYKVLDDEFRVNYTKLWRGIMTQNKEILRESCAKLGVTKVELFMSILTSNTYEDIMNGDNKFSSERRLGLKSTVII